MQTLKISVDWFDRLLPEGLPIPSSTLLSGPGGSGKPLIGNFIAADWLRQGGSVVFMSLQYPDHSFIKTSLKIVTQLDIDNYVNKTVFIELDANLESFQNPKKGRHFKANVVKPEIWDQALEQAYEMVPDEGPGILVYGSALNLLLFSPTYGVKILKKMKSTIQKAFKHSYLFSTSTTAKGKEIAELESIVDNLIMIRGDRKTKKLYLQVKHMKAVKFLAEEVEAPFSQEVLQELKGIADKTRKRVIPLVSKL